MNRREGGKKHTDGQQGILERETEARKGRCVKEVGVEEAEEEERNTEIGGG